MYFRRVKDNQNSRSVINQWRGYNHNYMVGQGEFFDDMNLTTDYYPLLTPRGIRTVVEQGNNILGIINFDNTLTYLDGNVLHYGSQEIDMSEEFGNSEVKQKLFKFGSYILFFPGNAYINMNDFTDKGLMGDKATTENAVTYSVCTADGDPYDDIVASNVPPENPKTGEYWLCNKEGEAGLYMWEGSMWQPIATTYLKIEADIDFSGHFSEGDTIVMNSAIYDYNEGSQIKKIGDGYIIIIGLMDEVQKTDSGRLIWFERKIPILDYVCVEGNRVWGCHYGLVGNKHVNEIYASKLGDFKNWYTYQGLANDSYAVTVGSEGVFTGCIGYQGKPTFFKENAIIRIFGSQPSEYAVNTISARGVQTGSSESLAIVDELLVYKSALDIVAFDGSNPTSISQALGRDIRYYDAVAGATLSKYHIALETAIGGKRYFTYDFKTGIWHREDVPIGYLRNENGENIKDDKGKDISIRSADGFTTTENGQMYIFNKYSIFGIGLRDNTAFLEKYVSEEWVDFYAETGDTGFEYPDFKYVSRITVRAYIPLLSELRVLISYDNRPFEQLGVLRGSNDLNTQSIGFCPLRCDHFRIRFEGHGDVKIYTLSYTLDTGSEE